MNYSLDYVLSKAPEFKGRLWSLSEGDHEKLVMLDGGEKIALDAIVAADAKLFEANQAVAYLQQRKDNYPDLHDLLVKLFNDIESGKDLKSGDFYTAIKAVHDQFPKP